MSALAVVQARMSSSRLPGKTLADVEGEPMLALQLRRLRRARRLDGIVVATSDEPIDDPVAALAGELGVAVHRGSRDDVLARVVAAIGDHDGPVARITADCPLIDAAVVDAVVEAFEEAPDAAYASNIEPRTFPDGLDVEVLSAGALRAVAADATDRADREHVTLAVRRDPHRFPQVSVTGDEPLGELRWTVDTAADLEFVRAVVRRLGDRRHDAPLTEVLAAVRTAPSLASLDGRRG